MALDVRNLYGDSLSLDLEARLLSYIDYPIPIKDNEPFLHNLSNAQGCAFTLGDYDKAIFFGHWFLNQMEMSEPFDKKGYYDYCLTLASYYRLAKRPINECYDVLVQFSNRCTELTGSYPIAFLEQFVQMDLERQNFAEAKDGIDILYGYYKAKCKSDTSCYGKFIDALLKGCWYFQEINQYEKANDCLFELKDFLKFKNISNRKYYFELYCNFGLDYFYSNNFDLAIENYTNALQYADQADMFVNQKADCYQNLAMIYEQKYDYATALTYAEKQFKCFDKIYPLDNTNYLHSQILYLYYKALCGSVDDYDEFVNFGNVLSKYSGEEYNIYTTVVNFYLLSLSKVALKYPDAENDDFLVKYLYRLELGDYNNKLLQLDDDSKYLGVSVNYHQANTIYSLHRSDPSSNNDLLYNHCLATKGASLRSMRVVADLVEKTGDAELKQLYSKIQENKVLRTKYQIDSDSKADSVDYVLESDQNVFVRMMLSKSGNYLKQPTWIDVRNALKDNEMAVEFCQYTKLDTNLRYLPFDSYVALLIRKDWEQPLFVDLFNDTILNNALHKKSLRLYSDENSAKLRKYIWDPIIKYATPGDRIYFSPSGIIHTLPVENLLSDDYSPLCSSYDLQRVSSTKNIMERSVNTKYGKFLLLGDIDYEKADWAMEDDSTRSNFRPLSGTGQEIDNIGEILGGHNLGVAKLTNKNASEKEFKLKGGDGFDVIHFATHGFFLDWDKASKNDFILGIHSKFVLENPLLRSGLALAGANRAWNGERIPNGVDDGILTAQEIKDLDLSRTQMVVLSACETGLGDINTDGVFGLQRAFKSAGVQTIVMSLWKVSDNATSLLMTEFYKGLLASGDRHTAFVRAKEAVRSRYPEAYYWAGFVMLD